MAAGVCSQQIVHECQASQTGVSARLRDLAGWVSRFSGAGPHAPEFRISLENRKTGAGQPGGHDHAHHVTRRRPWLCSLFWVRLYFVHQGRGGHRGAMHLPAVLMNGEPDFIQIPMAVLRDPALSHPAKLLYGRLKLFAGKNGQCNPRHATLATEVCMGVRQLRQAISDLRKAGWIDWRRSRTSYYTINERPEIGGKPQILRVAENRKSELRKTANL